MKMDSELCKITDTLTPTAAGQEPHCFHSSKGSKKAKVSMRVLLFHSGRPSSCSYLEVTRAIYFRITF